MPRNSDPISLDDGSYDPDGYDERQRDAETAHDYPEPAKPKRKHPAKRAAIPANAPTPQDHKPKQAAKSKAPVQREAEGIDYAEVVFDGQTYRFPADPEEWSVEATLAFEQGKGVSALKALFGERQWLILAAKRYRNKQFAELFDLCAKAGGFELAGN